MLLEHLLQLKDSCCYVYIDFNSRKEHNCLKFHIKFIFGFFFNIHHRQALVQIPQGKVEGEIMKQYHDKNLLEDIIATTIQSHQQDVWKRNRHFKALSY